MSDSETAPRLGQIGLSNYAPYLMNRIMGRYNASIRSEMAALGLTTPKMRALAVLSVIERPLIGELAVYAIVEQSTLSRALEQLDAEGLIRREPDPDDSRATRVSIMQAGRSTFEALWPRMAESCMAMFRGIPEEERRAFVSKLQKMLSNIRKHDFEATLWAPDGEKIWRRDPSRQRWSTCGSARARCLPARGFWR